MKRKTAWSSPATIFVLAVIVGLKPVPTTGRPAQYAATSQTPWGDPDLTGLWTNATTTPLERPEDLSGKQILTDEELAVRDPEFAARINFDSAHRADKSIYEVFMDRGNLIKQTSLIIDPPDGKLPSLTPNAQNRHDNFVERWHGPPASWEDTNMFDRCITRGLPGAMIPGFYNHNYLIVQTPNYVVIQIEMIHDARIIPLDGRSHLKSEIRQWLGDPRGHWEDDTLVVETTNFTHKAQQRAGLCGDPGCGALQIGGSVPNLLNVYFPAFSTGEHLHFVERFRRVDADTMDYRFTVTDPTVDSKPWTASIPMKQTEDTLFEYACHEGNYSLPLGLSGARADEQKIAAEAKPD
jgi:hypothetical protein